GIRLLIQYWPATKGPRSSRGTLLLNRQNVALAQDEVLGAVHLDLRPAVLGEDHLVADGNLQRDPLAVVQELAAANRDHFTLLRFFLRGVGQDDPTGGPFLLLDGFDDDSVSQWFERHNFPSLDEVRFK